MSVGLRYKIMEIKKSDVIWKISMAIPTINFVKNIL